MFNNAAEFESEEEEIDILDTVCRLCHLETFEVLWKSGTLQPEGDKDSSDQVI